MEERYRFSTLLRVRYADTDAQGHVFFSNYLIYFDQALTDYLKEIGYGYDVLLEEGIDFFYVDAQCTYKGRARFDDVLRVHARLAHIGRSSFTFEFSIYHDADERFIASGRIVAVAVDKATERPVPVPEGLRRAVENYEGQIVGDR